MNSRRHDFCFIHCLWEYISTWFYPNFTQVFEIMQLELWCGETKIRGENWLHLSYASVCSHNFFPLFEFLCVNTKFCVLVFCFVFFFFPHCNLFIFWARGTAWLAVMFIEGSQQWVLKHRLTGISFSVPFKIPMPTLLP